MRRVHFCAYSCWFSHQGEGQGGHLQVEMCLESQQRLAKAPKKADVRLIEMESASN